MNAALAALTNWLSDYAAVATVLLAVVVAAQWSLRRPAQRMTVAWSAWLGLAALAMVTALPGWPRIVVNPRFADRRVPEQPEMHSPASVSFEEVANELPEFVIAAPAIPWPEASANAVVRFTHPTDLRSTIAVSWLVAAGLALLWTAVGWVQTWRLLRRTRRAPNWIQGELRSVVGKRQRVPELLLSEQIATAAALGAIRPRILLPIAAANEAHAPAVRAALAHEWAHIRHRDLWLLAVERMLLPLIGWHPLFWLARRGVRLDQELLADASAAGDRPVEYAEALLASAQNARPAPLGLAALSLWESKQTLSRRITMLVDPNRSAHAPVSRRWQAVVVLFLLLLVSSLSLISLTADEPPVAEAAAAQSDARPADLAPTPTAAANETHVRVFTLRGGDTVARLEMLRGLLGPGTSATRPLRISADHRTNSIIATGCAEDLEVIRGILERLEQTAAAINSDGRNVVLPPTGTTVPPPPVRTTAAPAVNPGAFVQRTPSFARLDLDVGDLDPTRVAETIQKQLRDRRLPPVSVVAVQEPAPARVVIFTQPDQTKAVMELAAAVVGRPYGSRQSLSQSEPFAAAPADAAANKARPSDINPRSSPAPNPINPSAAPAPVAQPNLPNAFQRTRANAEAQANHETQRKLLALDLKEAELEVEAAKAELEDLKEVRTLNRVAVSNGQMNKAELNVRRAEIRAEKLRVMIEAGQPAPAGTSNGSKPPSTPPALNDPLPKLRPT